MTSINFTGLASGLDTDMIIKNLMEIERQPLERLEEDKQIQQSRLEAFNAYHDKLSALNTAVGALYLSSEVRASSVSLSRDDVISASVTSAQPGTYQVTVEQLSQVQKSVSQKAYASRTDSVFGTGDITLSVGETDYTIAISQENNSLAGIMAAVNEGTNTHGITASIIDNGIEDDDRYYLVLTGGDSSMEFTLESALEGGSDTLSMEATQNAQNAVAYIDGIMVTGKTNTIENAVSGVTLTLESVSPENDAGELIPTSMTISLNKDAIKEKIENFVTAYNDIIAFVSGNATEEEPSAGMLTDESMVDLVRRKLQNMLTTQVEEPDTYKALAQLGLSTNKDGTISLNSSKLEKAVNENFDDVANLLAGDNGIFKQYRNYLNNQLNSSSGLYAMRKQNVQQVTERIDKDIEQMEMRLEKRENMLLKRFAAMENLVSALNAQSEYLTQQMEMLSNMGGKKK
ncbi:MAG: flagellar filament capping protein FliD [Desulfobacterales bacterium]